MSGELHINEVNLREEVGVDLSRQEQIFAKYDERFQPRQYRQAFYPPSSGEGRIDALFPEGYFKSAEVLLKGVTSGELRQGIEGVAAVFLCRHYVELAIKYTLFHSRWLKDGENAPADDVAPVGKSHDLQKLWDTLTGELRAKPSVVPSGLDLEFVGKLVKEFHAVDQHNGRFRYPGDRLPVEPSSNQPVNIDFDTLLFNLQRTYDVLDTLDSYLLNTFGENEEWDAERRSWC